MTSLPGLGALPLAELAERLARGPTDVERVAAAQELGRRGGPESIAVLAHRLEARISRPVSVACADALAAIGAPAVVALRSLAGEPATALYAAQALSTMKSAEARDALAVAVRTIDGVVEGATSDPDERAFAEELDRNARGARLTNAMEIALFVTGLLVLLAPTSWATIAVAWGCIAAAIALRWYWRRRHPLRRPSSRPGCAPYCHRQTPANAWRLCRR
jgi:hypothetical protein